MAMRTSLALALSLAIGLGLIACGGGDESSSTQTSIPSSGQAGDAAPGKSDGKPIRDHEAEGDVGPTGEGTEKRAAEPEEVKDTSRQGGTKKSTDDENARGGGKPHYATDEERCDHEPSTCGPDENATPDYSNPDVRRAEERSEKPAKPTKCDSRDCEEVRRGER